MNHLHRVSVGIFAAICAIGDVSATEDQLKPQIIGFHSWDITYVPSAQIRVAAAGRFETASFVHVCREVYRGTRQ
jgi:hypothetical protein